jgi:hypothetical protein
MELNSFAGWRWAPRFSLLFLQMSGGRTESIAETSLEKQEESGLWVTYRVAR